MKAMVLAAGFGTRLCPFTLSRPKPLFPILDLPLLSRILSGLWANGAEKIVVNANHLREQLVSFLLGEENIYVQQEEQILGTGGGLRLAKPHFGDEPFMVVNGDIFHNLDLAAIYRAHCLSGAAVTMVLHDCPRFNQVRVDGHGKVVGFDRPGASDFVGQRLAFTGIQVINPSVLNLIAKGVFCDIIDTYLEFLKLGGSIDSFEAKGHYWTDIGTPADYLALHQALLSAENPTGFAVAEQARPFFLGEGVELGAGVQLDDWVAIGRGARIGSGASLRRVVVWDGAQVAPGSRLADTIIT